MVTFRQLKWHHCASLALLASLSAASAPSWANPLCQTAFSAAESGQQSALHALNACVNDASTPMALRAKALEYRAWLRHTQGDDLSAARDQKAALALVPEPLYRSLINQALYLRNAKQLQASLAAARQAEGVEAANGHGTSMMTQYHIGWSLLALGRDAEAAAALSLGIPLQPDFPPAFWMRAQAHQRLGETEKFRADLLTIQRLLKTAQGQAQMGSFREPAEAALKAQGMLTP